MQPNGGVAPFTVTENGTLVFRAGTDQESRLLRRDARGKVEVVNPAGGKALTTAPISGILISGDTRPETIQAAKIAGYPLLHKPVSPARLRAVLTSFAWKMRRTTGSNLRDEDPSR